MSFLAFKKLQIHYFNSFDPQNHPKREFPVSTIFPNKEVKLKMTKP